MAKRTGATTRRNYKVQFKAGGQAQVVRAFNDVGSASRDTRTDLERMRDSLLSVDAAMGIAQKGLGVLTATFNALKAPVDLAIGFEDQFATIRTLSADIGADLESELLDLAGRVPQTAADIANSAYAAISAGIPQGQVVGFLEAASKAAVAGGSTLTESTKALTKTLAGFSTQGVDSTKAMDVLFATVKRGDTTFTELASSIGLIAGSAGQFGSIEELGGLLATVTKSAPSTSIAVTQLNAVIKALSQSSGVTQKALSGMGIETGALALKQNGLIATLRKVSAAVGDDVEKLNSLTNSTEAQAAFNALLSGGMKTLEADYAAVTKSQGALADASEIMSATTKAQLDQLNASFEGALREIGRRILPELNVAFAELTALITRNGPQIASAVKTITSVLFSLGSWVAEHGPAIATFFATAWAVPKITAVAGAINGALIPALAKLGASSGAAAVGLRGLGVVISRALALAGPIGLAIGAAATIGIAIADSIGDAAEEQAQIRMAELSENLATTFVRQAGELRERYGRSIKGLGDLTAAEADRAAGNIAVIGDRALTAAQLVEETVKGASLEGLSAEQRTTLIREMEDVALEIAKSRIEGVKLAVNAQNEEATLARARLADIEAAEKSAAAARSARFKARRDAAAGERIRGEELLAQQKADGAEITRFEREISAERAKISAFEAEAKVLSDNAIVFSENVRENVTRRRAAAEKAAADDALRAQTEADEKTKANARKHARELARIRALGEQWKAQISGDAETVEIARLKLKQDKELGEVRRAGKAVADLLPVLEEKQQQEVEAIREKFASKRRDEAAKQAAEVQRLAQSAEDRQIALFENEGVRRLAQLNTAHARELEATRAAGQETAALELVQTREKNALIDTLNKEATKKEAERYNASMSKIREGTALTGESIEAIASGLAAVGIKGDAVSKGIAWTRGLLSAADALSYSGQAFASFASGNIWSGAQYSAGAIKSGAASVAYFSAAGGGGGGAGGGGASAPSGGGGGAQTAASARNTSRDLQTSADQKGKTELVYNINVNGTVYNTRATAGRDIAELIREEWRRPGGVKPPS